MKAHYTRLLKLAKLYNDPESRRIKSIKKRNKVQTPPSVSPYTNHYFLTNHVY